MASSNFLFAIRLTYAFTFTPAGHASLHFGIPFISIGYFFPFLSKIPFSAPTISSSFNICLGCFFVFRSTPQVNVASYLKIIIAKRYNNHLI